jgi:hypothetical protein
MLAIKSFLKLKSWQIKKDCYEDHILKNYFVKTTYETVHEKS